MDLFVCYPKCSTCRGAQKFLDSRGASYSVRHIVDERPTASELKSWIAASGLPIKRFFNTSGGVYKELGLKDKLSGMSDDEQIDLLASNGMLVKRPIYVSDSFVLVGFKEAEWAAAMR